MPEYLSPGVYVEEVSSGAKPIEGVSTSTAGFFGPTERGPVGAKLVTSWLDYQRWYGSYVAPDVAYLPFAVDGFFANGGKRLFVSRVVGTDSAAATATVDGSLEVGAIGPGVWGNQVEVVVKNNPAADEDDIKPDSLFDVTINYYAPADEAEEEEEGAKAPTPELQEQFNGLTITPNVTNNVYTVLNSRSKLAKLTEEPTARPTVSATGTKLAGGEDGTIAATNFLGESTNPNERSGLAALRDIDEIAILACPDAVNGTYSEATEPIVNAMVTQCETLKDRFMVTDIAFDQTEPANIRPPADTTYGAVYYPWIQIFDLKTNRPEMIPPSGSVVGLYARTDIERGVWKAPANEVVRNLYAGSDGPLEVTINKGEQDILNPRGVNVIRDFRNLGRDVRVWGARTMSSDPEWRYINVRRLFIYVEESIDQGTQWVVFEPNDPSTWTRVVASISGFLNTLWRDGGLMGDTPEQAFFVVCDRTTMTQDDIDNGRLICNVGIAPVKPAEFVIIRIGQKTMEAA